MLTHSTTAQLVTSEPAADGIGSAANTAPAQASCMQEGYSCFTWKSGDLLQGAKRVHIEHNGAYYQLQATRQGKLILTK